MNGLGIQVEEGWINLIKGIEEIMHTQEGRNIERSSSLGEKGILFTEVSDPGLEVIRGKLHNKGVVGELLATHSAQVAACLGEVDEVFLATQSEDAREKLGRKGFESGGR
jgi:hypothetical protein